MTDTLSTMVLPTLSNQPNVEIAQTGQWKISTGLVTLTDDDFANAIAALACPAVHNPVLKLGHDEPMPDANKKKRWDGEPAIGYVNNMAVADDGHTIVGDYTGMPGWMGPVLSSAYPNRSMEATWDFVCQLGHVHPFVITAVALLGVTPPGIGTLESLQDVASLYGVDVAATQSESDRGFSVTIPAEGASTMPNPNPVAIQAGVTAEDIRRGYYDSGVAYSVWVKEIELDPLQLITVDETTGDYARVPVTLSGEEFTFGDPIPVDIVYEDKPEKVSASRIVYASKEESRPKAKPVPKVETELAPKDAINRVHQASTQDATQQEGVGMDPIKLREALGLTADASDDDVMATIAQSREPTPTPEKETASTNQVTVAAGAAKLPDGAVILDASIVRRLQEDAQKGVQAMEEIQKNRRDTVIAKAIEQGKFPPSRREHYELMWAGDPKGTEDHIGKLGAGLVPLEASGYPGTETFEQDAAYYGMYPEEMKANG